MTQSQVLEGELAVAAEEEGKELEQVEQENGHRAGIVSGSGPTINHLRVGWGFGEGQEGIRRLSQHPAVRRPERVKGIPARTQRAA